MGTFGVGLDVCELQYGCKVDVFTENLEIYRYPDFRPKFVPVRSETEARREGCQRPHADSGRAICKADQEQPGRCHAPEVSARPEGGTAFCILLMRIVPIACVIRDHVV